MGERNRLNAEYLLFHFPHNSLGADYARMRSHKSVPKPGFG